MTLQSATSKVRYVGDGVQTAFPIPFRFLRRRSARSDARGGAGGSSLQGKRNDDGNVSGTEAV